MKPKSTRAARHRSRRLTVTLASLAAAATLVPLAIASGETPTFTSFSSGLPTGSTPDQATRGPDGNVWFTDGGADAIGQITPAGNITEFALPTTKASPSGIAAGPDGNLWFTESGGTGAIGRITPAGQITEFSVPTANASPTGIAAGPDGNLWFTESGGSGAIGRITPAGQVTEFSSGLTPSSAPSAIAAGPDGALWFTESAKGGRIGRIDSSGTISELSNGLGAGTPSGIAAGPDGAMWFTQTGHAPAIGRIAPDGTISEFTNGLPAAARPAGIAPGADGALYFADAGGSGAIGQVTTSGAITEFTAGLPKNAAPTAVTEGADQAIWFTMTGAVGRLSLAAKPSGGQGSSDGHGSNDVTDADALAQPDLDAGKANIPLPVMGRTALVGATAGTVRVKQPGAPRYAPLTGVQAIPIGSQLDSRRGTVRLVISIDHGHVQGASFVGGVFLVRQSPHGHGMTDIYLRGGDFGSCRAPHATGRRIVAAAWRAVRWLWGRDRGGRFRTHGSHAVATVRGTIWQVVDRCDGTLTRVVRGSVAVRDLRRHRTVIVHAGHSYLARR